MSSQIADDRLPWVDVLRGLSILAVVLLHINIRIPFAQSAIGNHLPREVSRVLFGSGFFGVRVFFVISGFLITTTILRRWHALADVNVARFYQLRFARIAPCLLALLALLSVLHFGDVQGFVVTKTTLGRALVAALAFRVNQLEISVGYLPAPWDVLWSLSIEEVFYLAYPLLLRFIRAPWFVAGTAAVLVVTGPLARTVWAGSDMAADYGYLAGFDCIAFGCLAAVACRQWRLSPPALRIASGAGAMLFLLVVVFRGTARQLHLGELGLDVTLLSAGTGLFLWGTVGLGAMQPSLQTAWLAPLRWLGQHSYEVYLTHSFVTVLGARLYQALGSHKNSAPVWHLGIVLVCALLGWLVARFFSEPANRFLRQRFNSERQATAMQLASL